MKEFVGKHYPDNDTRKLVVSALDSAEAWIRNTRAQQTLSASMPNWRWDQVIKSYEQDHNLLYAASVRPNLPWIVWKVNEMAGFDVLGMNVDADLSVTKLFTEADKACYTSNQDLFSDLYDDPYSDIANNGREEFLDKHGLPGEKDQFFGRYLAILMCVMIEVKLAQCHFLKNCRSELAKEILDQIPEESYTIDVPNEDKSGKYGELGDFHEAYDDLYECESMIKCASEWIPTVTKTVDALFHAGLATDDNLSLLFGRSGFVSYRLWTVQREKVERAQMSISSFVTRWRWWKEGCIDNDTRLGLRIKYLNRADRRNHFRDMLKLGSAAMGSTLQSLTPTFEQFVERYGWSNLGLESEGFFRDYLLTFALSKHEQDNEVRAKKAKLEIDNFGTSAEACRHFFDASTLEEAVWDIVGVPRLIALDADKTTMTKIGWRCCGLKASIGDKTVRLGHRVVHVCSEWWTVWQENNSPEGGQSHLET